LIDTKGQPDREIRMLESLTANSRRSRGARRTAERNNDTPASDVIDESPANAQRKASWARLIQKIYEVDPP
jgi:hypothetical protein